MKKMTLKKNLIINQKIIINDGLIGGGKSLLSNVVSGLPKVDQWILDYRIEQTIGLLYLKKIDFNTAKYILKSNYNQLFYDNSMLRHANFRKSDLTSILKHPRYKNLKKRMNPSDETVYRNYKNKIILHFCTHNIGVFSKSLFESFGKNLVFLQLLRSPLNIDVLKRISFFTEIWKSANGRYQLVTKFNAKHKQNVPFYINQPNKYCSANKYEKTILILEKILNPGKLNLSSLEKKYKSKVILIPFENFITDPKKYVKKIASALKVSLDKITNNVIKKNSLPRKFSLLKNNEEGIKFIKKKVRKAYLQKLIKMNDYYEKTFLTK